MALSSHSTGSVEWQPRILQVAQKCQRHIRLSPLKFNLFESLHILDSQEGLY